MSESTKYIFKERAAEELAKHIESELAAAGYDTEDKQAVYDDLGSYLAGRYNELNDVGHGRPDIGNVRL